MKWRAASVAKKIRKRHSIRTLMTISTGPNPHEIRVCQTCVPEPSSLPFQLQVCKEKTVKT
eukprot:2678529-Amphidinium_carterae.1